ncbi:MAG TPA: hypothetical protein VGL81_08055 [Polyangiaceae bacterium]|jgi:hypothetical protein
MVHDALGRRKGGGAILSIDRIALVAAAVQHRLALANRDEILARYDLGAFAHIIRYDHGDYGDDAQESLANLMHLDSSAIRRHARVSETLYGSELQAVLQLRTPEGAMLRWSHLEILAAIRSPSKRRLLAAAAATDSLSVRALRSRM